jgi:hemerythrin
MAFQEWNSSFNINVQQSDDQHQQLVAMINDLHDAMRAGRGNEVLGKTLDGLITYTRTHFADEDLLMTLHDYPEITVHKAEHEKLIGQVLELQQRFSAGQSILTLDVMMFLMNWLMEHIQIVDKKYGVYLNSKGIY